MVISLWDVPTNTMETSAASAASVASAARVASAASVLIGAHLSLWRVFLDVNQSLGRVKSSDLVQSGWNTSSGVVEALQWAHT